MRHVPLLTDQERAKLDRALDRIDAGISVYRTHGRPVAYRQKRWEMDGIVGVRTHPYPIPSHRHVMTRP